jgi:hypothetical protein
MNKSIALISMLALLWSCNNVPNNNSTETSDTLKYTTKYFEKHSKTCVKEDSLCATVKFAYPVFEANALNEQIINELLAIYHSDDDSTKVRPKNFDALAQPFLDDYDANVQENKDFVNGANAKNEGGFLATPWNMEAEAIVQQQTPKHIILKTNTNWFMGGAHPISMEYFYVYDRKTFKRIRLDDLFKPNYDQKLLSIAETVFRKQEHLKPADALNEEHGYFFENGRFLLNDNFTLTATSIKFLYNVYEIKSYAAGITEIEIPLESLKEILK